MKRLKVPNSELIANPEGRTEILSFYNDIERYSKQVNDNFTEAVVLDEIPLIRDFPSDGEEYSVILDASFQYTIYKISAFTLAGSLTLTANIGGTPLGGSANSVTTSQDYEEHASANVVPVGGRLTLVPSDVLNAEWLHASVKYRRALIS